MRHSYLTPIDDTIGDEHYEPRERAFLAVSFLLFIASVLGTVCWCRSMSGGMAMPGGWTMSMGWMKMTGQSWLGMAASFMAMWIVMMVAMSPCVRQPFVEISGSIAFSPLWFLSRKLCPIFVCQFKGSLHF